jgi:deazaflavin-dependent oxidoreductase (nitroreductase family)
MADHGDWNTNIINEFRANSGQIGGGFAGAPMTLVHHHGRKTGKKFVAPMMYLADENDPDTIYVFASKAGAPTHPDWYHNLVAAGAGEVELGTEHFAVTVAEVTGAERDRLMGVQAARYPGFAEYEKKTAGIRKIPVLALHRS